MRKLERVLHRIAAWILALALYLAMLAVAYAVLSGAMWPEATGKHAYTKGGLTLDVSNATDGYIMAKGEPSNSRLKLRITKDGNQMMYDLNSSGQYEAFPLQLGSGNYSVDLFRNVRGNSYSQEGSMSFTVQLKDENAAFLLPNQYVSYTPTSLAVQISEEICAGLETDEEKLEAVRQYVVANFSYDFDKAATVKSGTMPSIEYLLDHRKGICQDIAAFTACVLRVQGIPTQFVIGYANRYYHAWNNVLINGQYVRVDLTAEVNSDYRDVTYTVERFY